VRPPAGTVERWCLDLVTTTRLEEKVAPPPPPDPTSPASWEAAPISRLVERPGRPPELVARANAARTSRAVDTPEARARLVHTFLHHELQAAELFAWAVLRFPETPPAFRAGLVRLAGEELAHLRLYARHLAALGGTIGDHEVRDWFWEHVAACETPSTFVAWTGLGLEGGNLEHGARFAELFRAAGDEEGARILDRVARDEIAHVRFAREWFERFTGEPLDYDRWRDALPRPLTPAVFRGKPLNRRARARAGLDEAFLERLEAEPDTRTRSTR